MSSMYNNVNSLVQTISKWFNNKIDKREEVSQACYNEIDSKWNPHYLINVFKEVLK